MNSTAFRFLVLAVLGPALLAGYLLVNHRQIESPAMVTMPGWAPFWPVMALPYLAMLVFPWFLPLALRDRRNFVDCMKAYAWGYLTVFLIWIFYPTEMVRPEFSPAWWNFPYQRLIVQDRPANIFPCGHVVAPLIAGWFVASERKAWIRWLVPLFALGVVSIVTTWQHRPVDVFAGIGLSLVGIWLGRRGFVRPGSRRP